MTRKDVISLMGVLQTAYPSFYAKQDDDEIQAAISLWAEMFADDDAALVGAATKALIATRVEGYPPTIGAVKEKMHELKCADEMTEDEAWAMVLKALKNSLYSSLAEFRELPKDVQRIVHAPEQLRDWALMDSETVNSVVASNFKHSYRVQAKRIKDMAMLPADVRAAINGMTRGLISD